MSDQLMITLQAALQQLATQHTAETLGDRATYLGASDIGACPRKTILTKLKPPEAVLEVKSPETIPEHPYGSWETQLYLQMGLLADSYPDYTVEKGAILAVNFGKQGMQLFNGYTPQATIYEGLIDRAITIWNQYQRYTDGDQTTLATEAGPLCGYCSFLMDCPKFEAEEVLELTESVEILTGLQHQQRELETEISIRKSDLLAIVDQRGPLKAHGQLLRKAIRTRKVLDTDRLGQFLQGYSQSLADFQKSSSYSFLEIKKAA